MAERVLAKQGWNAWPACSRKLGLRGVPQKIGIAPQARPSTTPAPAPSAGPGGTVITIGASRLDLAGEPVP